jgi:hypothetical protein
MELCEPGKIEWCPKCDGDLRKSAKKENQRLHHQIVTLLKQLETVEELNNELLRDREFVEYEKIRWENLSDIQIDLLWEAQHRLNAWRELVIHLPINYYTLDGKPVHFTFEDLFPKKVVTRLKELYELK